MDTVMHYPVSQQCHDQLDEKQELCEDTNKINRQTFMGQRDLSDAMAESIIHTDEARNMQFWCRYQSWTYCPKCQKLETRKLQPAFRRKTPSPLHNAFKCGNSIYIAPNIEDVPLILRNRTKAEVRMLCSLAIHCGEYKCHFNGYRQQTGPFRVSWSKQIVTEKIDILDDPACRHTLLQVYQFLMQKEDSSYAKFVHMHNYQWLSSSLLYEIFSTCDFHGIECALWPSLYHTTAMGKRMLEGQTKCQNILHAQSALSCAGVHIQL